MEIFIHTEQFARYISSGQMCAVCILSDHSHLLKVDEGMTTAGQAALTDLPIRLALRLQIPEDVVIVIIIITLARVTGGELGELQVRAGKEKEVLHARFWTLEEDRVTQSSLSSDSLPGRCLDALEDEVLDQSEHLLMSPLSPDNLCVSELHLQQLGGPQHRGELVSSLSRENTGCEGLTDPRPGIVFCQ